MLASRSLAHLAVLGGDVDKARSLVAEGLRLSAIAESPFTRAELLSTLGLLELALGNPRAALAHLDEVSRFAAAVGVGEPGMLLFVPDRVEALVAVGDLDAADAATTGLEQQIRGLVRPFIKAVAQRCHGLVAAARGDLRAAMTFLADATATTPPNRPFELARTLLAEGTVLRRARRRSAARLALERAAATFAGLGAPIWEANARAELARLGGRPAQSGALTATERQIAELVAAGKTNAEVARTLHVSPKTVEWNLSKVYRKLRVGSRTQLAAKLATRSE